jgi:hypothetical protein
MSAGSVVLLILGALLMVVGIILGFVQSIRVNLGLNQFGYLVSIAITATAIILLGVGAVLVMAGAWGWGATI